jgi:uncharacterized protein (DUF433 family)
MMCNDLGHHERIEIDPAIMFGKPVINGTRITVEHVLRKLGGGMSIDEILADHPHLTHGDILAAQNFCRRLPRPRRSHVGYG